MDPCDLIRRIYRHLENRRSTNISQLSRDLQIRRRTAKKYLEVLSWIRDKGSVLELKGGRGSRVFILKQLKYKTNVPEREESNDPPFFIGFNPPIDLIVKTYGILCLVEINGWIAKGTNAVTEACEKKNARLVVIAKDTNPPEIWMHLPLLCDELEIPYAFVPSKTVLGRVLGLDVPAASCAIISPGGFTDEMNEVLSDIEEMRVSRNRPFPPWSMRM